MKPALSILLVDDHALFRKGMELIVQSFEETKKTKTCSNGKEALEELKKEHYDIVLLDLEMPIMDGWETAKKILSTFPDSRIIMISSHDGLEIISELIEIGVHSYLLKDSEPEEVYQAITYILNNDFYYNQIVSKALHKRVIKSRDHIIQKISLTKREVEVLELICKEMTMKEIGLALFLSEQTIHTHRKNIMKKTNGKNAVSLVKYALKNDIIQLT